MSGRFQGSLPPLAPIDDDVFGEPGTCPCEGSYDTGVATGNGPHYVWVAFLHYNNDEYRQEQWLRDYRLLPTNWLTCKLSGSPIFHCQLFFWNQRQQAFVTFSVDAHQQHVHYATTKKFQHGWTFLRLTVTQQQELDMYEFLAGEAAAERPFNWLGAMLLFLRPIDTGGASWFCSQLVVAALQRAGLLPGVRPEATSPSQVLELLERSASVPIVRSLQPVQTKQTWIRVAQERTQGIPATPGLFQFY